MANDPSVEQKTPEIMVTASPYKKTTTNKKKENVLNKYRSYTYNFTLAVLEKDDLKDPLRYRKQAIKNFVVVRSGGKGPDALKSVPITTTVYGESEYQVDETPGKNIIESFNKVSPGRFDFFIDNVEIDTAMAFTQKSSVTQASTIKFDIVEPYSINGFLEALHVGAIAAGYPSHSSAAYVLKMQFLGYPDSVDFPEPEVVKDATRYFSFRFSGIEIELTERGTVYRCSGFSYNDGALGQPNIIKEPISTRGKTVKEILEDLFEKINKQIEIADNASRETPSKNHDIYEIVFPSIVDGKEETSVVNKIAKSSLSIPLKDNQLYKYLDPATSKKSNNLKTGNTADSSTPADYIMKDTQVQFAEGRLIHEAIASIIRDSDYTRGILQDVAGNIDSTGHFNYIIIKVDVVPLKVNDPISKRSYQKYTYKVLPYRVHHTSIPDFKGSAFDVNKLKKLVWREFNYLYTGKNIDVLNFKLNFNLMFIDSMPKANANNDVAGSTTGAAREATVDVKSKPTNQTTAIASQNSGGTLVVTPNAASVNPTDGTAGQISDDPYWVLARNMHTAIVDSNAALTEGDLEIVGDPFFLVTGGVGNYSPKENEQGITEDGEAAHNRGFVYVTINFRNPEDIDTFENGGLLKFRDDKKVPFSGVYMVSEARSTFKDGQFKQVLKVARMAGQVDPTSNLPKDDPAQKQSTVPTPGSAPVADTAAPAPAMAAAPTIKYPIAQPLSLAPLADISAKDLIGTSFTTAASGFKSPLSGLSDPNPILSSVLTKFKK
jgi:hypothetical protein